MYIHVFSCFFEDTQRTGGTNHRREIVPEARSHRQEGLVSSSFLPGLSWRQAPQPHLLTRAGNTGRPWRE